MMLMTIRIRLYALLLSFAAVPVIAQTQRFVTVEKDVKLEVLDWGGSGRAVVLLAGGAQDAHSFDEFAPKLATAYHVYGISRRGFGASSAPAQGYLADSLADDVLAIIDSLGLKRPVLAGHSLAGEELSSIGSRHPERVAGLVYLDAGYPYACYDSTSENVPMTVGDVQRKLARITDASTPVSPLDIELVIQDLLDKSLPLMERDLRGLGKMLAAMPNQTQKIQVPPLDRIQDALNQGQEKYTSIHGPVLAIFAAPSLARVRRYGSLTPTQADSADLAFVMPQIRAFERCAPGARIVRIAHADHFIFWSNEGEVLREMRSFIDSLP